MRILFKSAIGICLFSFIAHAQAQIKISKNTEIILDEIILDQGKQNQRLGETDLLNNKLPFMRLKGEIYLSFLAKLSPEFKEENVTSKGILIGSKVGDIISLRVPLGAVSQLKFLSGIAYLELAGKVNPNLDKAIKDVRADSVHQGYYLPQPFTGKNVLIGVTDWGFDYTHPMFYDTGMNQTRINAVWDQFKNSGPAPSGFNYGTEFSTKADIINAQADTFNIYEYATHGSHVAGIAGGGGAGTTYRGVAFESEFLFTTFLIDAAAVLDAFTWMKTKADQQQKRLVINMSWGLYYMGTLDGNSLLSQAITTMSDEGVVFVTSAGNNADENFHINKEFSADTLKTRIKFDLTTTKNLFGQSVTMWGQKSKSFGASMMVLDAQNFELATTPFYYTDSLNHYVDSFLVVGGDTIIYNLMADAAHPLNEKPHLRLRVKRANSIYKICLKVVATSGTVHLWNVTELTTDVGNWGMPFEATLSGWTAGDAFYGIGEPACSEEAISVAAYSSEYYTPTGTLVGGAIAYFSSYGPTMDERIKPDISAPGVSIASSISSFTSGSYTSVKTVNFNGRDYKFSRFSGTSMSSPMVTGIVALLLEARPDISPAEIKNIIRETARQDAKTGAIPFGGSTRWGAGKIHAHKCVLKALGLNAIGNETPEGEVLIYPNPTQNYFYILTPFESDLGEVRIFDLDGKLVKSFERQSTLKFDTSDLPSGIYFVEYQTNDSAYNLKFVKE